MEIWAVILVAFASGIALLITTFFTGLKYLISAWMHRLIKRIYRRTYIQEVEKVARFLELFEDLQKFQEIQRCLIFHGHNSKGVPTVGHEYTIRAIHGWYIKPGIIDPLIRYNFELTIDVHYIRVLIDLIKVGRSIQVFDLMPKDSKLYSYYETEGVKYAELYYLGIIDNELIFLSTASYEKEFTRQTQNALQFEVDRMRTIMGEK